MKLVGVVVLALACSAPPHGTVTPRQAAIEVLPDVPFAMLDHAQRTRFMKERVVPAMKPLFLRHDAREFADFGCATCHGEAAAAAGRWHMPASELPGLDLAHLDRHDREDLAWMRDEILPAMAALLREPPRGKRVPDGFGCTRCHPTEIADAE